MHMLSHRPATNSQANKSEAQETQTDRKQNLEHHPMMTLIQTKNQSYPNLEEIQILLVAAED